VNRTQFPSDVIALVVLWRLHYGLTLRDLSEMFFTRGLVLSDTWPSPAIADDTLVSVRRRKPKSFAVTKPRC
jgi:hypothetical protein